MSSLAESPEYKALRRFIDLTVEKRALRARVDEINGALAGLEPALLSYLGAAGVRSMIVENNDRHVNVFSHRDPWVRPRQGVSKQEVCEALKLAGLGRMVKESYSTQSLTAHIQQLEERAKMILGIDANGEVSVAALKEAGLRAELANILTIRAAYTLRIKEDPHAKSKNARYEEQGDDEQHDDDQ